MVTYVCCEVCGNERPAGEASCPYCGAACQREYAASGLQYKTVNLEKGMPLVRQALAKLDQELIIARTEHCRVVLLIHGYGSSGRGGAIKKEVRAQLQFMQSRGRINDFLGGEDFSTRSGRGRQILRRFPFLRQLNDLNRANRGITLVVL